MSCSSAHYSVCAWKWACLRVGMRACGSANKHQGGCAASKKGNPMARQEERANGKQRGEQTASKETNQRQAKRRIDGKQKRQADQRGEPMEDAR
eukprot:6193690-Pleurochrysis_carterae.AAC.1